MKNKKKIALITGITGQDGSYLLDFLLDKNYEVHGIKRRSSLNNTQRIENKFKILPNNKSNFFLHHADMTDTVSLTNVVKEVMPDEIYNLAAQSHVEESFSQPEYTANTNGLGALRLLEAIKILNLSNKTKFYQASTSELFGKIQEKNQKETTPFYPRSPYAVSKLYAYWITINYREAYNIFACNGILFNHESPLRGENFVTRKITKGLSRIKCRLQSKLILGNLNAKRDWGHARDYAEMQWMMLQQKTPDDYVIATGEQYTVREFVNKVAKELEMEIQWVGEGLNEKGFWFDEKLKKRREIISIDSKFFRPTEVDNLIGDSTKAFNELGWKVKTSFSDLVKEMVKSDFNSAKKEVFLRENGF